MKYLVIPTVETDGERLSEYLNGLEGVRVNDDRYAPHVWVVSFQGTPLKLTNLIWPDGRNREDVPMRIGIVIRAPNENINGLAARDFWTLFGENGDA